MINSKEYLEATTSQKRELINEQIVIENGLCQDLFQIDADLAEQESIEFEHEQNERDEYSLYRDRSW